MKRIKELRQQNQEISELCRVLSVVLKDATVCDTDIVRELLTRFTSRVCSHLDLEENSLYAELLAHSDSNVCSQTNRFLNNSREVRRIFAEFDKKWGHHGCPPSGDKEYIEEIQWIFDMVLKRIQAENDEFFPMADTALA